MTIALLEWQGLPGWWAPVLKIGFTLWCVLFAPLVGPLADAFPQGRVMAAMNGVKIAGLLALAAGINPVAAFALGGLGAAAYFQVTVAVGVLVGAGLAGRWVALRQAPRMLWAGVLPSVAIPVVGGVQHLGWPRCAWRGQATKVASESLQARP